jgi:hypothetical protein
MQDATIVTIVVNLYVFILSYSCFEKYGINLLQHERIVKNDCFY